jgi:hypothetical protein
VIFIGFLPNSFGYHLLFYTPDKPGKNIATKTPRRVVITAVGNMKIHVRLRYVFSFGEKMSGVRIEKLEELKPDT